MTDPPRAPSPQDRDTLIEVFQRSVLEASTTEVHFTFIEGDLVALDENGREIGRIALRHL